MRSKPWGNLSPERVAELKAGMLAAEAAGRAAWLARPRKVAVRQATYRGESGYLVQGYIKAEGRRWTLRQNIFATSKATAEKLRDAIKSGREDEVDHILLEKGAP